MKKILSAILLIGMIIMLEFNLLKPVMGELHRWIEPLIAFLVMVLLIIWNGLHRKSE
jgi:hypothetical protein